MVDSVDRAIVSVLRKNGRASWLEVGQSIGVPTSTAFRRGTKLLEGGLVIVALIPYAELMPKDARIFELRIRCVSGSQRSVAQKLADRTDTRWVAIVTSEYDVAAEIIIPVGTDFGSVLLDDIQQIDGVVAVQTALVIQTAHVANDLAIDRTGGPAAHVGDKFCSPDHLTDVDRAILGEVRLNGRLQSTAIARNLGLEKSSVRRRLNAMIETGCARFVTLAKPELLGYEEEVLIRLHVAPDEIEDVVDELGRHQRVHYVAVTLSEASVVCEIVVRTQYELYDFMQSVIAKLPGVTHMIPEVEIVLYKRAFVIPPWVTGKQEDST